MDRSDVQETLVHLYLRLNGYFVSGYIVHAAYRLTTELDVLAVRFPRHQEPQREIPCCARLAIPADQIDFIVGEVKGGTKNVNFNVRFRENPEAVRSVLERFGGFGSDEIDRAVTAIPPLLDPARLRKATLFPELELALWPDIGSRLAKLRFIPFATEQTRTTRNARPCIFQESMFGFLWDCFRPKVRRVGCDVHYNFELWGPQFLPMVWCFKDKNRTAPPTLAELYTAYGV